MPCLFAGCENDPLKPVKDSVNQMIEFNVSTEQALSTVGGSEKMEFEKINDRKPVIITRQDENSFKVFSTVCTHQGCEINLPDSSGENFECPCHGSIFSFDTGEVIKGPANDPLQSFVTSFDSATNILKIYP